VSGWLQLFTLVPVIVAVVAFVVWRRRRGRAALTAVPRHQPVVFPASAPLTDQPAPVGRVLPAFDWPHLLDEGLPAEPACGSVYPLIYNDLVEWAGDPNDVDWVTRTHGQRLLDRAREQARRYCVRSPAQQCRGVTELDHQAHGQLFRVGTTTYANVIVVYMFRCSSDPTPAPADSVAPGTALPRWHEHLTPRCDGSYQLAIHHMAHVLTGCDDAGVRDIERRHARNLLDEARREARAFCARHPEEMCTTALETGHGIQHHCWTSGPLNATYVVSSIVYLFDCPVTI